MNTKEIIVNKINEKEEALNLAVDYSIDIEEKVNAYREQLTKEYEAMKASNDNKLKIEIEALCDLLKAIEEEENEVVENVEESVAQTSEETINE